MNEMVLTGLDGSNPLGFLAAIGTLEVATIRGVSARMAWRDQGVWRPVLYGMSGGMEELVTWIDEDRADCRAEAALTLTYDGKQDLKPTPGDFGTYLESIAAMATPAQRRGADWAAAFGSDVIVDNNGNTKPTALHFTAGQQQFLKMVNELMANTTHDDIREALFGPWTYSRPLPVMGWDSTTARDYALRAADPSGDKKLGVPGADWLGIRGLPSFPVAARGTRLATTGCSGGWKSGTFRWPVWTVPLDLAMVRTALRLPHADLCAAERAALGLGLVFSSGIKRSDQGGYGSFTPASVG